MYQLKWKARLQVNKLLFSIFQNKVLSNSGNRMLNICVLKSFLTTLSHKRHTCPTYIIRKLTLSCRRVINFPQTPIKWLFEKFILCRVLSIQIVSALKTAFKTSLRHVCYALCNQKTGTEKRKWNVQFYNNVNYMPYHLLYFVFFLCYVGEDTRPWKSTFDRPLPLPFFALHLGRHT